MGQEKPLKKPLQQLLLNARLSNKASSDDCSLATDQASFSLDMIALDVEQLRPVPSGSTSKVLNLPPVTTAENLQQEVICQAPVLHTAMIKNGLRSSVGFGVLACASWLPCNGAAVLPAVQGNAVLCLSVTVQACVGSPHHRQMAGLQEGPEHDRVQPAMSACWPFEVGQSHLSRLADNDATASIRQAAAGCPACSPLATVVAEEGSSVQLNPQSLGKLSLGVSQHDHLCAWHALAPLAVMVA